MDFEGVRYVSRDEVFAARPHRADTVRFRGLWLAGSLAGLTRPAVAVVGTRAPTETGRARTRRLAADLAHAGVCVLSGLALGIDGAAHAGALAGGGATVGVLGGGHGQFFPRRNRALAHAIVAAGGAVLSPYPPEEPARPAQFLQRNGVVAALADAVVVVEAARRSGALNTAGWAAALGIDVLAFPGDVDRPKAAGCNALIRDGAVLVRDARDVLGALGALGADIVAVPAPGARPAGRPDVTAAEPFERALLGALREAPAGFDELLSRLHAQTPALCAALVRLEVGGLVERRSDTLEYALREPTSGDDEAWRL